MTTPPARILIVDDEPFNVDSLEQELGDLGYRTASARDGQEALAAVAADPPDLVLLDVMMPVMDGFEVCRRLKEDEATRLIPVIIMTALGALEDRVRGIEAGADDFLTKPVDPRELFARIQTALKLKQDVDRRLRQAAQERERFARFVPDGARQQLAAGAGRPDAGAKSEQDVTVLFLDISAYSRLSERLAPAVLDRLVERYFSVCLDHVRRAGGDINETAGDGFMALFQAADRGRHAAAAAGAALALVAAAGHTETGDGLEPLHVHLGLNSGVALVGATRLEGRSGARWTYTATGPVTNLAARLAAEAGPDEILVGPETAQRLQGRFRLVELGMRQFRHMAQPVQVHRLLEARPAD